MFLWLAALIGCTDCPSVAEVEVRADSPEQEAEIRAAMQDFVDRSGRDVCVAQVHVGPISQWWNRGFTLVPEQVPIVPDVYRGMCIVLDRDEGISSAHPELFTGVGINERNFRTLQARRTEDFARTCARSTDREPWYGEALQECGFELSDDDAFMVDLFGGPERGLPRVGFTRAPLGSVPLTSPWGLWGSATAGSFLVLLTKVEEGDYPDRVVRWILQAHDLPTLDPLWSVTLSDRRVGESHVELYGGLDSVKVHDLETGEVWRASPDGLTPEAPVIPGYSGSSFAEGPSGWRWFRYGARAELYDHDPILGLGPVEEVDTPIDRIGSSREGVWRFADGAATLEGTDRSVGSPDCCGSLSAISAGRAYGGAYDATGRLALSRALEDDAWSVEEVRCSGTTPYRRPVYGVDRRLEVEEVWSEVDVRVAVYALSNPE
ncbi:MAG: hypothetical protein R3F61_00795 [Myxococcota bacterium]